MEAFIGAMLLMGLVLILLGAMAAYSKTWEGRYRGRHIKVVNRGASEELCWR